MLPAALAVAGVVVADVEVLVAVATHLLVTEHVAFLDTVLVEVRKLLVEVVLERSTHLPVVEYCLGSW